MEFILFLSLLLNSGISVAEGHSAKTEEPVVTLEAGKPVTIKISEDKVIELRLKDKGFVLNTDIVLAENSCTPNIGLKAKLNVPILTRALVPVWKNHPSKKGQAVVKMDSYEKKPQVTVHMQFLSRIQSARFNHYLEKISSETPDKQLLSERIESYAWIECKEECSFALPKAQSILFWDENFQTSNNEITLTYRSGRSPEVNQITTRLQQIPVKHMKNAIEFSVPEKAYGISNFFAPGIGYQLQWIFMAKNILDPQDNLCQMKWDIDFTTIFTQFVGLTEVLTDPDKIDVKKLAEYLYDEEDKKSLMLQDAFKDYSWNDDELKK